MKFSLKLRESVWLGSAPIVKEHSLNHASLGLASLGLARLGLQCVKPLIGRATSHDKLDHLVVVAWQSSDPSRVVSSHSRFL